MRVEGQRVDARQQSRFRAASELVTTAVTVRDADGRLVINLEQADFVVEEDGVAQPITQFTKERVPVSLSLTLDISDSMRGQRMADARGALAHFLDKLLAEDDEASLLGFQSRDAHVRPVDDRAIRHAQQARRDPPVRWHRAV